MSGEPRIGGCPGCGGYTENDSDPRCTVCSTPERREKALRDDVKRIKRKLRDEAGR